MKTCKSILLLSTCLFFVFASKSQVGDSISSSKRIEIKLGVYYNSHLNYYGRTDSLNSSALIPVTELWINKHLYFTAAPVFIINNQGFDYAGAIAVAGYRDGKEKKWMGNLYVARPFYKENSKLPQSTLKAQLAATGSLLRKLVNITVGTDVKISDRLDFGANAGLDHVFRKDLQNAFVFIFNPTIFINAGTQRFTTSYYKPGGFLFLPGGEEVNREVNRFSVLSYEVSAPIVLVKGKLQLLFSPAYVIPRNLLQGENTNPTQKTANLFYATLGGKISL